MKGVGGKTHTYTHRDREKTPHLAQYTEQEQAQCLQADHAILFKTTEVVFLSHILHELYIPTLSPPHFKTRFKSAGS